MLRVFKGQTVQSVTGLPFPFLVAFLLLLFLPFFAAFVVSDSHRLLEIWTEERSPGDLKKPEGLERRIAADLNSLDVWIVLGQDWSHKVP